MGCIFYAFVFSFVSKLKIVPVNFF
uniref:Uncharacterized protein n=1 Tax=Anguilla anguilla TaxID=7936 RepID=A0A0E9WT26_ANGAN